MRGGLHPCHHPPACHTHTRPLAPRSQMTTTTPTPLTPYQTLLVKLPVDNSLLRCQQRTRVYAIAVREEELLRRQVRLRFKDSITDYDRFTNHS